MANPNPNPSSSESTVHNASNRFAQQSRAEPRESIDEAFTETTRMFNDLMSDASAWLKSNSGTAVTIVAAAAAFGLVGYFIGKNSKPGLGDLHDF